MDTLSGIQGSQPLSVFASYAINGLMYIHTYVIPVKMCLGLSFFYAFFHNENLLDSKHFDITGVKVRVLFTYINVAKTFKFK